MKTTYIYHSGFLVETAQCYYLFDYYKGSLPALNTDKPIFVFASHRHQDHYNPEIFALLKNMGMQQITAVLAKDIPAKRYPEGIEALKVTFHQTYALPHDTTLKTLLSTDEGVAFLLQCPEGTIYHAGDLNDWVWEGESEQFNKQMTGSYRHEIDMLKNEKIDVAFVPLDPRQKKHYSRGMLYFLKEIDVEKVYPMHYWEQPEIIDRFLQEYPEYARCMISKNRNIKERERLILKKVAFICVHNSCRSQIAEALGKHLASDVFESFSAGTETKPQINQDAVRIMKEMYGIDMEETQYSKLISDIPNPDVAISMGCNVGCPFIGRAFDDNWGLEDPTGKSDEEFKVIIREIENKIVQLRKMLCNEY